MARSYTKTASKRRLTALGCLIEEREGEPWASCTLSFLSDAIYFTVNLTDGFGLLNFLPQDVEPEDRVDHFVWIRQN